MASENDEDEMNKKVTLDDDNIKDDNNEDDDDGNSLIECLIDIKVYEKESFRTFNSPKRHINVKDSVGSNRQHIRSPSVDEISKFLRPSSEELK